MEFGRARIDLYARERHPAAARRATLCACGELSAFVRILRSGLTRVS
jgi:hypothetical protein